MSGQGHQDFVDELARFAAGHADPRVTAIAERTAAPLRVLVRGRRGVGCVTVARALDRAGAAAGISVTTAGGREVDVVVYVTTEVVKPEDIDAIGAAGRPVLAVLNKADLAGSLARGEGPIAAARTRCAELAELAGVPTVPMAGLLAVAAVDDLDAPLWAALRTLAAHPGVATSLDGSFAGFMSADNPVPADVRLRLLNTLDLFGIALGVAAVRQGRTAAQVRALLRRTSGVDAVLSQIAIAGAEVRYQRVLDAVAELEALAVGLDESAETISGFLSHDDTVVARMAAAVDLAESAGLGPDHGEPADWDRDPSAHLPRAVRWQRYSRASASELHRACGADIARGSMRLWSQACGSLPGEPQAEWR
ncbi:hypothetical protein A5756_04245 [Mycobacterium sp. 852002-53434_SCH5985345]|uniref:hypothetical protein n=1 Tax=unclassified Mycobacterium TaxID=2642494 RepID=UPI0007FFFF0A|nr:MULTISPECIES: hypothetical protein [unclassified Mycobacterium]OBF59686.1 hypothetical protein A5756_04245 [Mycobacterium sp. 852002-53434_SCH5985345]OBF72439.1 hypothetical protein A5750_17055 [Mycobacterium sp. 852002-51613_SCH5001154]